MAMSDDAEAGRPGSVVFGPVGTDKELAAAAKDRWEAWKIEQELQTRTLRDKFAMAALPAVYVPPYDLTIDAEQHSAKRTAKRAYELADAMLEARKK